jgi:cytochrome d ubiquinol oxidase subunit II
MMNSVAPFWDGNETWLVLGGGGLFASFPTAYSIIMPALYIPIILMLISLIFRGVAFEFRFKAEPSYRRIWDLSFHFGSLFAAFSQGVILGAYLQGLKVESGAFAGHPFDWCNAFSLMTGVAVIFGYMVLGATWLIYKTENETQDWARRAALYAVFYVVIFMIVISLSIPFLDSRIYAKWFSMPNMLFLSPLPILTSIVSVKLILAIKNKKEWQPFFYSISIFILCYIGLIISIWPWIIPYSLTIKEAAAASTSLSLLLIGTIIILPLILFYTGYLYYVFRGKATKEPMY